MPQSNNSLKTHTSVQTDANTIENLFSKRKNFVLRIKTKNEAELYEFIHEGLITSRQAIVMVQSER